MYTNPFVNLRLIRTLSKLNIAQIVYEKSYNGSSFKTFKEAEEDGAIYIGDLSDVNDGYPSHRWIRFKEKNDGQKSTKKTS